jgi:hypothetical protein
MFPTIPPTIPIAIFPSIEKWLLISLPASQPAMPLMIILTMIPMIYHPFFVRD